ncbi:glutamine--tRNA ligase family protein [Necator americanus]|uniref:glutamine--tRNA ligase n=1 Tax=Necator americanus TaxID=51031 RepID=W2TI83_NECAM|nr:glutamine--tRNA ligase family protein [Necator americanus]ETN81795.1 glutamine--tRNA ligase family protein [Necator americanus]
MANLLWLGLSEQKAKETEKNATLLKQLSSIIAEAEEVLRKAGKGKDELTKQQGTLLYQLGTKIKQQCAGNIPLVISYIISGEIKTEAQVSAALDYLLANVVHDVEVPAFEKACGVGVVVTPDEIEDAVSVVVGKNKSQLMSDRYSFNVGKLLGEIRSSLPWADGAYVKKEVDLRILELLGPKTIDDLIPKKKVKKEEKSQEKKTTTQKSVGTKLTCTVALQENGLLEETDGAATIEELMRTRAHFHKVGENYTTDGYITTPKTKELLRKHMEATGGKVITRFPPEPNGVLHIGHAKAININFGYAKVHGGSCNLRFDDTNPEKEEEKFFTAIEDIVHWLGYTPARITHSSDNFQQLYEWAVELIKKGYAYVCHQKVEDIRGFEVQLSPWRDRPIEDSLRLFEDMKNGKFDEGEATLRLKMTLEEGKVDPVAYRIKYVPHHRTGDKWCIYPTYDYTHCLCDSIENITHSLCTKEFQSRRSSYYALCNMLDIYCPVQWEYGRLNVNYTVVSKRKILKLIESKIVNDWDDPRLFTLTALRRRGIPAEAINAFVAKLGLTMTQMVIDPHVLDATVRDHLNVTASRTMVVLEGLKMTIENFDEMNLPSAVTVPDFPSDPKCSKTHQVAFDRTVYIERSDYRQVFKFLLKF